MSYFFINSRGLTEHHKSPELTPPPPPLDSPQERMPLIHFSKALIYYFPCCRNRQRFRAGRRWAVSTGEWREIKRIEVLGGFVWRRLSKLPLSKFILAKVFSCLQLFIHPAKSGYCHRISRENGDRYLICTMVLKPPRRVVDIMDRLIKTPFFDRTELELLDESLDNKV